MSRSNNRTNAKPKFNSNRFVSHGGITIIRIWFILSIICCDCYHIQFKKGRGCRAFRIFSLSWLSLIYTSWKSGILLNKVRF